MALRPRRLEPPESRKAVAERNDVEIEGRLDAIDDASNRGNLNLEKVEGRRLECHRACQNRGARLRFRIGHSRSLP